MDVLSDMLASLRLNGGVFIDAELRAPFSVRSHIGPEDCRGFFPVPRHLIAYHYVRSGAVVCRIEGRPPVTARAGEIVLLPVNTPHYLDSIEPGGDPDDPGATVRHDGAMLRIRTEGAGEATWLYCGYLGTLAEDNALLASLPPMMLIDAAAAGDAWMVKTIDFAAEELGGHSSEMVGKLAEALFAEAVRRYVAGLPEHERGWLAGLRDPAVGKALALIQRRYAEGWTLDGLAREAGVSRTVLAERFRLLIGESPMQYCARWRMRRAAEMLRENRHNASSVAYSVGFNSEAAFNRAFKRTFGLPPAAWRREAEALS